MPVGYCSRVKSTNSYHTVLSAGHKRVVARPAPARPSAPSPAWRRSGPSERCQFVQSMGRFFRTRLLRVRFYDADLAT